MTVEHSFISGFFTALFYRQKRIISPLPTYPLFSFEQKKTTVDVNVRLHINEFSSSSKIFSLVIGEYSDTL